MGNWVKIAPSGVVPMWASLTRQEKYFHISAWNLIMVFEPERIDLSQFTSIVKVRYCTHLLHTVCIM